MRDNRSAKSGKLRIAEAMVKVIVGVYHVLYRLVRDCPYILNKPFRLPGRHQSVDHDNAGIADNYSGIGPETVGRGGLFDINI